MMQKVKCYTVGTLKVDPSEVLRYAKMPVVTPETETLLQSVIKELSSALHPKLCYRMFSVKRVGDAIDLFGMPLHSGTLERALAGCSCGILFAVTLGVDADRAIARAMAFSPAKALLGDAYCTAAVEALCNEFCSEFSNRSPHMRVSPGYGDLSLSLQKHLFAVLEPERHIGLCLNQSLMMSPSKSVSALFGMEE